MIILNQVIIISAAITLMLGQEGHCVTLSPENWSKDVRSRVESQEDTGYKTLASETKSYSGENGVISATGSPIAVQAGIEALQQGGSAADAAATVALTQIATQLGSVVSYAGIMSLVYYDAKEKKVYSLDAGYNSYLHETHPESIPVSDAISIKTSESDGLKDDGNKSRKTALAESNKGRETLVPGFMSGIAAMHKRFGKIPFADLFAPAIWYSENGIIINSGLEYHFDMRHEVLSRTPEGKQFLGQSGRTVPKEGDRFFQPQLATTLKNIAQQGIQYMYAGPWSEHFVNVVQREGGKVTLQDLARYQANWAEPSITTCFDRDIYTAGFQCESAYHILTAINLAEQLKLDQRPPYWKDPTVLREFPCIADVTDLAPRLDSRLSELLRSNHIDCSPEAQLTKQYARPVVPLLDRLYTNTPQKEPHHSN